MKLHIGMPTAIHQHWLGRMQSLSSTGQPWPTVIVPDARLARWLLELGPPGLSVMAIEDWWEQCVPAHLTWAPQGTWEILTSLVPETLLPRRYASVPGISAAVADLVRRGRRIGIRTLVSHPSDRLPWPALWNWYDRHLSSPMVDELGLYDYTVSQSSWPMLPRSGPIYVYGFTAITPLLVDLIKAWHVQQPVEIWALEGSPAAQAAIWGDMEITVEALEPRAQVASTLWIRPSPAMDLLDAAVVWVKQHDEHLRHTIAVETDEVPAVAWKRAFVRHQLIASTERLHDREETLWQLFVAILIQGSVRESMVTRWLEEAGSLASVSWKTDWWQRVLNIQEWADLSDLVREAASVHNVKWRQIIEWAESLRAWDAFAGHPTPSMVSFQLAHFALTPSLGENSPIMPLELAVWVPTQHVVLAGTDPDRWLCRMTPTPFDGDGAIKPWVRMSDPGAHDRFLLDQLRSDHGWVRWMVSTSPQPGPVDELTVDAVLLGDQTSAPFIRAWYQSWRDANRHSSYTGWVDASLARSLMPTQLSPSALEDFGRCPLSFLLSRILHISGIEDETPDITPQMIGMWAHRALELTVRRGLPLTLNAMRACVDAAIAEYPAPTTVPSFLLKYAADGLAAELYEALVRDDWHPQGQTAVEVSLAWEWVWPMQGRVDRIDWMDDGSMRLVDYKTGAVANPSVPSPANMQLLLYQQALADKYGVAVEAELYGISQKSRFLHRRVTHAQAVAQRSAVRSIAEGMRARMHDGKFWPVPDGKIQPCRFCTYRLLCPARVVEAAAQKNAADAEFLALWAAEEGGTHDAD